MASSLLLSLTSINQEHLARPRALSPRARDHGDLAQARDVYVQSLLWPSSLTLAGIKFGGTTELVNKNIGDQDPPRDGSDSVEVGGKDHESLLPPSAK